MNNTFQKIILTIIFSGIIAFTNANAQVTIAGSTSGNGSYATLKAAFDALNTEEVQAGNSVTITINANTYTAGSETATCMLEEPSVSNWTSLTISPIGAVTVSGAIIDGSPLIDLNGADLVTINGLNSGINSLTISNITVSSTAGTSTIRLINDATNNTITNCSLLGSSTMTANTIGGTIFFWTGVSSGNDNNTISNCNLGPAGANLPSKAVYSGGTTSTTTTFNSGITVTGCNIYDFFAATVQSAGIYVAFGNTEWTITNNKLYQTAPRIQGVGGSVHSGIQFASNSIQNSLISGNTIGYSSSNGTGIYEFEGGSSASRFYPIYFSSNGTLIPSSIQGNFIKNIKVSGFLSGILTTPSFAAIFVNSGLANIGTVTGNIIGSSTTPGSIEFITTSNITAELYGICFSPTIGVSRISNNMIGGLSGKNSSTGAINIYGIRSRISSSGSSFIINNVVGYPAAPIENNALLSNTSSLTGIYSETGSSTITGNKVEYLNCAAPNTGTGASASVIGISSNNILNSFGNTISQNSVKALTNLNASEPVSVNGIVYRGNNAGTHFVSDNILNSFNISSSSESASMNGIYVAAGTTTFQNNFISLGTDVSGNNITRNISITGINETSVCTDNFYFNTVCIGGSGVVTGTSNTYAFFSDVTANTRNYKNNIFYNVRSNGAGTGNHYSVKVGGTSPNPTGLTINNNLYFTSGTGGVFGFYNNLPVTNLANWKISVGQDANSVSGNPQFINYSNDYKISLAVNSIANNNGVTVTGVTTDIEGNLRSLTKPDIGCYEFTGVYVLYLTAASQYCPSGNYTIKLYNSALTEVGSATGSIANSATNLNIVYSGITDLSGGYFSISGINTLKVWSNLNSISPSDASSITYNMTTSQSQEFSNNLLFNGNSVWSIPSGDVNQDEIVDAADLAAVENDLACGTPGCGSGYPTDLNCDGNFVDASDLAIAENNQGLYVTNPPVADK